jgi:ketosteroid isomerase-like protein
MHNHAGAKEEKSMDSPSTNAEAMQRYVEALERKDLEAATAFWADDVLLHFPGRNPFSGDFVGKQAFMEHYGRLSAELGGTVELAEVRGVLMGAEHVVALVRERAVRGERTLEFERVNVYSLGGGKITEIWEHDYDPYALDEFWA